MPLLPIFPAAVLRLVTFGHHCRARHIEVTLGNKNSGVTRRSARSDFVPRYFFVVACADKQEESDPPAMFFLNDVEALRYAERTIAELQKEKSYHDLVSRI